MASFQDESRRLSQLLDPSGTAERDWQDNEGVALGMVLKSIESLFRKDKDLSIEVSREDPKEPTMLVMTSGHLKKSVVIFKFRASGSIVHFWPMKAPGSSVSPPINPKSIQVDGGWGEEELGKLVAEVFASLS